MFGKIRKWISLLAVSAIVGSCLLTSGCSLLMPEEEEALLPPLMQPATIAYKTQEVTRGTLIQQLKMSGSFYPEKISSLSFEKQSGRLKAIYVTNGQAVKAGDLLAELNTETLQSQIRIQQLEVEKSELSVAQQVANNADTYTVKKAKLSLQQAKYQLEDLQKQLKAMQIFAPIDGEVIYVISTAAGESIAAYQTVVKVADTSSLILRTTASNASELPIGAKVAIEFKKMELTGEVVANPTTLLNDPNESMRKSALIRIEGQLPADAELGSDARITFVQDKRENVLVLPRTLINLMSGRRYVNVLEDGVRVEKDVEVGLTTDTDAEIVKGLNEGDQIIVS